MILSNIVVDLSGEPRFADVDAIHNRTSYASEVTTQRADFRINLITRDGSCVFSGEPDRICAACHILPHSKGDNVSFLGSHNS